MSERISFTAHGDATGAQYTVGVTGIDGYLDWFRSTMQGFQYEPLNIHVATSWYGWSGMDITFDLDVVCGTDISQLRSSLVTLLEYSGLMDSATVSASSNQTNCSSGQMINIGNFDGGTVYGGSQNNQGNNNVNTGGGNNNKPSTFEEITAWLKAHETEAMFGGLILAVLLLRR